jgi:hypothetical protein
MNKREEEDAEASAWREQQAKLAGFNVGDLTMESPNDTNGTDADDFSFKPSRRELLLSTWLSRELPARDWLFVGLLCTTSRWLTFGETGAGKTLLGLDVAGAAASAKDFLGWKSGGRRMRVMYLDGEMPAETAKERLETIGQRYGTDLDLWFYNRDMLTMPPLNSEAGEKWLTAEIDALKPDLIIFDNIMSLLVGSMSDPESWAPIILLMRKLTSQRIAQIWMHHTGHDASRSYGDKTREWQMDTVVRLVADEENETVTLDFTKSRLRTPKTKDLYKPKVIACGPDGWAVVGEAAPKGKGKDLSDVFKTKTAILAAYDRLAEGEPTSPGFDGVPVRKVPVDAVRDAVRDRGFLDVKDTGGLTPGARKLFGRAKTDLIVKQTIIEADGRIWRLYKKTNLHHGGGAG